MPYVFDVIIVLVTLLSSLGLIFIIYSRGISNIENKLFVLTLVLVVFYLISHGIHFLFIRREDVTVLDKSCHSMLLSILVSLSFFVYYFLYKKRMPLALSLLILVPSIILLILLWKGYIITQSHAHHHTHFEAHYSPYYPVYLIWYILLLILNIVFIIKKFLSAETKLERSQLLLLLIGLIFTNFTAFLFGMYLPWILGFYYLVEMSPLSFLAGIALFTTMGIGKYNLFPHAVNRLHSFSITKKVLFAAIIIVPIIILLVQVPIGRFLFAEDPGFSWNKFFIISLLGGIVVGLTMSFVIVKVIANPITKIKDSTLGIKNGNYGVEVDYNSDDEIGELAQTFNQMSVKLKEDELTLKANRQRIEILLNAFEKSNTAIAVTDTNYMIIEANKKFVELCRLPRETVLNSSIIDVHLSKLEYFQTEKFLESINNNLQFESEIRFKKDYGRESYLLTTTSIFNKPNEKLGMLFFEVDITELKKLEQQLINNEKLAALGKMSAILAHEIKTPLTSIKMNADMIAENIVLTDMDKESFGIISKEITRLNNLVKEVLQLSRQVELNKTGFDIHELIDDIIRQQSIKLESKNCAAVNNVDKINIFADKEKIRQVILNLIDNAFDAFSRDNIIEFSSSINNGNIKIFIQDNGSGIAGDDQSKIFDPFFTSKASGTGLGLAIAQKIIEQHLGEIRLASSIQGETIFEINLPIN